MAKIAEKQKPASQCPAWQITKPTALLVLADGTMIEGQGAGAKGIAEAELCFNTAITGYQEILTDPSYAGQIVTFTFPHIGNTGANDEDIENYNAAKNAGAVGAVFKAPIGEASNFRANMHLDDWLKKRGIIALYGVDTRALTGLVRDKGLANAVIAHKPDGKFTSEFAPEKLKQRASQWHGLENLDLAGEVSANASAKKSKSWNETSWSLSKGYGKAETSSFHVVVVDFGIKRNILRLLAELGFKLTVLPAGASGNDILSHKPDGVFLSNGPGDPAATGKYAIEAIRAVLQSGVPLFGICLGHQMLALALGAKTLKMHQGHHGANHPVKDFTTGKVEIVSMNHGFAVDGKSLPKTVEQTHVSLFDRTNCGLRVKNKPVFSVQHHPEASPGPQDSHYLFRRFYNLMAKHKGVTQIAER